MRALAKLYLEAAKVQDDGAPHRFHGACDAICTACRLGADLDLRDPYRPMSDMYEADAIDAGPWDGFWGANFGAPTPLCGRYELDLEEAKQCRVLMLLFMSAMAEAGDI